MTFYPPRFGRNTRISSLVPARLSALGSALLLLLWFASALPAPIPDGACASDHIDERAAVAYVHDGDTFTLKDGRKVRLIGLNTPELSREERPAEPLARAARDALRLLLEPGREIGLRFDEERADRYGRVLAHVYTDAGDSVERYMLEQGYGAAIVVPPNIWNMNCYWQAERRARAAGLGIWALPYYQPIESTRLAPRIRGFHLITGRIRNVGESRRSLWLDLEGNVALRVAKKDLRYFGDFHPQSLLQREVIARGWLIPRRRGPVMQVRHPIALEIQDEEPAAAQAGASQ